MSFVEKYFEVESRGIAVKTIREMGPFTPPRSAREKKRPAAGPGL